MKKNEIVHGICTDITVDGHGIARSDGKVIFVKGMIPGEEGQIKVISDKKSYAYGIIDSLSAVSPDRREEDCPVAYKCGGCDFRHIDYKRQLSLKRDVLVNTFRDLPVRIEEVHASPKILHYRNKVQVPVKDHRFGFYRRYSNDIVESPSCLLQFEEATDILNEIRELLKEEDTSSLRHIFLRKGEGSGEIMLGWITSKKDVPYLKRVSETLVSHYPSIVSVLQNINTRGDNVILGEEEVLLYGKDRILDIFGGIRAEISLKSFYQVNAGQMVELYQGVKEYIEEGDRVLDLYSGIGTISLFVSDKAREVTGVEIVRDAVENAKRNASLNHLSNVSFLLGDAGKGMKEFLKDRDCVILDPPRKGVTKELVEDLIEMKVPKIIYVSCNPATLHRDLQLLKEDYDFDLIRPYDMFPYTVHCECLVCLRRKSHE